MIPSSRVPIDQPARSRPSSTVGRFDRGRELDHVHRLGQPTQAQLDRLGRLHPVGHLEPVGRREHLAVAGRVAEASGSVDGATDVVVAVDQQYEPARDAGARAATGTRAPARCSMATTAPTSRSVSTPTIITPSPSHFSTRTPNSGATSRTTWRRRPASSTAASSPSESAKSVNPQRSRKLKLRSTLLEYAMACSCPVSTILTARSTGDSPTLIRLQSEPSVSA